MNNFFFGCSKNIWSQHVCAFSVSYFQTKRKSQKNVHIAIFHSTYIHIVRTASPPLPPGAYALLCMYYVNAPINKI